MALTGQQKAWVCEQVERRLKGGRGQHEAFRVTAAHLGCVWQTIRNIYKKRDFWMSWARMQGVEPNPAPGGLRKAGCTTALCRLPSRSKMCKASGGKRGYLGRRDFNRSLVAQLQVWARAEEEQGHELSRRDLLTQFVKYLARVIYDAEEKERCKALPPAEVEQLEYWRERMRVLQGSSEKLRKQGVYLAARLGYAERAKQRTTSLTPAEEKARVVEGWQYWDRFLWLVGCADAAELKQFVNQPERFVVNRQACVISMSDQVPVWLKPDSGRRLMPRRELQHAAAARKLRKRREFAVKDGKQTAAAEDQPRTLVCAGGEAANSRSRWTLICRQIIRDYFSDRDPVGMVDDSILVLPGVHARLDNISHDGTWIVEERFVVGEKLVVREAGSSAGNVMQAWRRLREEEPGLFKGLRVWQSPTAFADSVIFGWQQAEEAQRFECVLRLVDSLGTHWTDRAQEQNYLQQQMQACVPAGCTPLVQPTDTGFAQPAKAAGREEHERLRSLLRQKARQEGTGVRYKVGCREILQTVQAMHLRMCELNQSRQTVLAEARACGWLHWRPQVGTGRLVPVQGQPWANGLTEGSSRMGPDFREQRSSWVEDGVALEPSSAQALVGGKPSEHDPNYFNDDEHALQLTGCPDMMPASDLRRAQAAMLHPRARTEEEELSAQLALVTPQARCKPGRRRVQPTTTRADKVARWEQALKGKSIQKRLMEVQGGLDAAPGGGKLRGSLDGARGKKKKGLTGKFAKALRRRVMVARGARKTRRAEETRGAEETRALVSHEESSETSHLIGLEVRCVAADASRFWQNAVGRVVKVCSRTNRVTVRLSSTGTEQELSEADVIFWDGSAGKPGMRETLDLRRVTVKDRQDALALTGGCRFARAGEMLESPEVSAAWEQLRLRGVQSGDRFSPDQLIFMNPHPLEVAVNLWESESEKGEQQELSAAQHSEKAVFVVVPVHSNADHWTVLLFMRAKGKHFRVQYFDSLQPPSKTSRHKAEAVFHYLSQFLWKDDARPEMPATEVPVVQADNWTCGYHMLNRIEEGYRRFRGEAPTRVYREVTDRIVELNKWVSQIRLHMSQEDGAGSSVGAGVAPIEAGAGVSLAQGCCLSQAESTGAAGTEPLPAPPATAKASAPTGVWGCTRCRFGVGGCSRCCPEKQFKELQKRAARAGAASQVG